MFRSAIDQRNRSTINFNKKKPYSIFRWESTIQYENLSHKKKVKRRFIQMHPFFMVFNHENYI